MKTLLTIILPALVVCCAVFVNLVFSADTVSFGSTMQKLDTTYASLRLEQKELDTKLASLLSLQSLKNEATTQGFVPISGVQYLAGTQPVAMR